VTFQSPTWSTAIPDGAEVQFTVYVRPEGASSPQGGSPNTCVSSDGKGQGSFVQGMAMTYTYPSSAAGTFDVTITTTALSCDRSPIQVTVRGPTGVSIHSGSIENALDDFTVTNGVISGYPADIASPYMGSFTFDVTPSDGTSDVTIALAAGALHGPAFNEKNPAVTVTVARPTSCGPAEDDCSSKNKGDVCNDGICNDSPDLDGRLCDTNCPFPSSSEFNPCFDKSCYINGSFHPQNPSCSRAVDAYCSENPENPGCGTFGVCTLQCDDTCDQVSTKFSDCREIESEPIVVAIEFALREGDCDFDASCPDPKECITKSLWKSRQTQTAGSSDGGLIDSYGISEMVKSCIGEYFENFGRYEYFMSTAEMYLYQDNERCSSSYQKGGAKATIIDTESYTAAEALSGIEALASSKACLDTIPADDLVVSITGYNQNGTTCAEGGVGISCPGGDFNFLPDAECISDDFCTTAECCANTDISGSSRLAPLSALMTFMAVFLTIFLSFGHTLQV
jgi:hypothetical protein